MSLTKVSYSMITGAPLNILDFGADPTGINDSAPAIQAAIDAANDANQTGTAPFGFARTTLVFPAGVYLCKSTLTFKPIINYVGTRATTYDNSPPPDYSDTRGSILVASVDIYNNDPTTAGVLVYVYTGDITIENIVITPNENETEITFYSCSEDLDKEISSIKKEHLFKHNK